MGTIIAVVFAWLGKRAVGKAWLQELLDGLEVGVNNAWEEYVKEKKKGGKQLAEDEKQKARSLAMEVDWTALRGRGCLTSAPVEPLTVGSSVPWTPSPMSTETEQSTSSIPK